MTKTVGSVRWTYTWDVANQLLKVVNGTTQGVYACDGNGRMLESIEGSQNTYFAYMGTATLCKNGTDYIYAGAQLVAFTSDNLSSRTPRYYHTDALGSVRLMTKDDGTVFYGDRYQPYGQDNGRPYCPSCPTNPQLKFTGEPVSQTTGLLYVKRGIEAAGFHWTGESSREALFRHRSFVSVKARRKPAIGEIIQLDMMRKTFLAFIILIRRASPDPMIPEETVSVIDRGTPNWFANSTVADPIS